MSKWILINVASFQRELENVVGIATRFTDMIKLASIEKRNRKKAKNLALIFEKIRSRFLYDNKFLQQKGVFS